MAASAQKILNKVESLWLNKLYRHNQYLFSSIHLPSHDQTHHFRVWQFARRLILAWSEEKETFRLQDIEMLILAVFFHDTGMSKTMQARHGIISRKFCEAFLKENPPSSPVSTHDLLEAIEQHDNKDYTSRKSDPLSLLVLLNLADDLDAFGLVGVYRYVEIYLQRSISLADIPAMALSNLSSRYDHMACLLPTSDVIFREECLKRYSDSRNFFETNAVPDGSRSDPDTDVFPAISVMQEIQEFIIQQKKHPLQLASDKLTSAETLRWWQDFSLEWGQFNYPPAIGSWQSLPDIVTPGEPNR